MIQRRDFLVAALFAGCAKPAPEKRYTLTGDVLSLDTTSQAATIRGDKIEGWMEAMTMEYPVKDKSEFNRLVVGQRITATVFVGESKYYIGDIKVTGK